MTHWLNHSLVLASNYRISHPDRVGSLLARRTQALADLGAHHVLVYQSVTEPDRVLVLMAIHSRGPVLEVLRSRTFFEWFDAAGVEDIPAVFAGEEFDRLEVTAGRPPSAPEVMVSMVTAVDDLATLRAHVRDTVEDLRAAGIHTFLIFTAFDDPREVMMLVLIDDEERARSWLDDSELAMEWMGRAGIGAYPPVFIGRFRRMIRVDAQGAGQSAAT